MHSTLSYDLAFLDAWVKRPDVQAAVEASKVLVLASDLLCSTAQEEVQQRLVTAIISKNTLQKLVSLCVDINAEKDTANAIHRPFLMGTATTTLCSDVGSFLLLILGMLLQHRHLQQEAEFNCILDNVDLQLSPLIQAYIRQITISITASKAQLLAWPQNVFPDVLVAIISGLMDALVFCLSLRSCNLSSNTFNGIIQQLATDHTIDNLCELHNLLAFPLHLPADSQPHPLHRFPTPSPSTISILHRNDHSLQNILSLFLDLLPPPAVHYTFSSQPPSLFTPPPPSHFLQLQSIQDVHTFHCLLHYLRGAASPNAPPCPMYAPMRPLSNDVPQIVPCSHSHRTVLKLLPQLQRWVLSCMDFLSSPLYRTGMTLFWNTLADLLWATAAPHGEQAASTSSLVLSLLQQVDVVELLERDELFLSLQRIAAATVTGLQHVLCMFEEEQQKEQQRWCGGEEAVCVEQLQEHRKGATGKRLACWLRLAVDHACLLESLLICDTDTKAYRWLSTFLWTEELTTTLQSVVPLSTSKTPHSSLESDRRDSSSFHSQPSSLSAANNIPLATLQASDLSSSPSCDDCLQHQQLPPSQQISLPATFPSVPPANPRWHSWKPCNSAGGPVSQQHQHQHHQHQHQHQHHQQLASGAGTACDPERGSTCECGNSSDLSRCFSEVILSSMIQFKRVAQILLRDLSRVEASYLNLTSGSTSPKATGLSTTSPPHSRSWRVTYTSNGKDQDQDQGGTSGLPGISGLAQLDWGTACRYILQGAATETAEAASRSSSGCSSGKAHGGVVMGAWYAAVVHWLFAAVCQLLGLLVQAGRLGGHVGVNVWRKRQA